MSPRLLMACLLAILVGCSKHPASSPSAAQPTADGAVPRMETSTAKLVDAAADEPQIPTLLNELTQAVRKCAVEQRRAPKNLEELVSNGYLSRVPPAPAGKKFAIDKNLQVYLANQ